jgi:hypothetical protein
MIIIIPANPNARDGRQMVSINFKTICINYKTHICIQTSFVVYILISKQYVSPIIVIGPLLESIDQISIYKL